MAGEIQRNSAQAPAPGPALQAAARKEWRGDSVQEQRVSRYLALRSWLKGRRGAQMTLETLGEEALSASRATARRVVRKMVAKRRLTVEPQADAFNRPLPSVYILRTPEYTGSSPPAPQSAKPARQPASYVAEIPKRRVKSSREDSTTNQAGSATLTYQNTHGDASSPAADVAARLQDEDAGACEEPTK